MTLSDSGDDHNNRIEKLLHLTEHGGANITLQDESTGNNLIDHMHDNLYEDNLANWKETQREFVPWEDDLIDNWQKILELVTINNAS